MKKSPVLYKNHWTCHWLFSIN